MPLHHTPSNCAPTNKTLHPPFPPFVLIVSRANVSLYGSPTCQQHVPPCQTEAHRLTMQRSNKYFSSWVRPLLNQRVNCMAPVCSFFMFTVTPKACLTPSELPFPKTFSPLFFPAAPVPTLAPPYLTTPQPSEHGMCYMVWNGRSVTRSTKPYSKALLT